MTGVDRDTIRLVSWIRAVSFYPGYSANFFDGQHYVMKEEHPRCRVHLRRSFRDTFPATLHYVYAGFRCVRN